MHNLSITPGVLQGGAFYPSYISEPTALVTSLNPAAKVDLDGNPGTPNPTITNEFNNPPLRSNVKGTMAMFKNGADPNSASNQFFFNVIDNSSLLDSANGFTVFAGVVGDGMSLIDVYANQLPLVDLNPDINDDGTRDGGVFSQVPILVNQTNGTFVPLILTKAKPVDYLGSGSTTNVPAGGFTISNKDWFIDTGATFTGTGGITIGAGRTLGIRENYVLTRDLINHGTLAPGLALGVIGLQNNYFQFSDGLLNIQLNGTTVDTQYDRLILAGSAFLAGRLQVSLLTSFTPAAGNSFTVLTAQTIVGGFTSFDLPQLTAGLVWNIDQSTTAITLSVVSADFNKNGIVDAADYVVWRKTNGTNADYLTWRDNLGNRSGGVFFASGSTAGGGLDIGNVPEPSTSFLVFAASMFFGGLPRRRRVFRKTPSCWTDF